MSTQAYPAVSPYPANGATPPTSTLGGSNGAGSGPSAVPPGPPPGGPSGVPASGPGSGFPARSGLAGIQPHGQAQNPYMGNAGSMGNSYGGMQPGSGAGLRGGLPEEKNVAQMMTEHTNVYARKFQILLDRSTPHTMERWLFTFGVFLIFGLNVVLRQGWYIVCYALAIYILNLFLAFLQPRFDPSVQDDLAADEVEEGAPGLPGSEPKSPGGIKGLMSGFRQSGDEEFRPFIRRLPEFKFWYSATRACVLALFSTVTRATDLPVYWPILLVYFLMLFALTMRRQIEHMIKYKYIPFDLGRKAKYGGKK